MTTETAVFNGALWRGNEMVRAHYAEHTIEIKTGRDVCAALRAGAVAWPGCYALAFVTHDGACLSFCAVRENLRSVIHAVRHGISDGWRVVSIVNASEIDEPIHCDHTGERIA